MTSEQEPDQRKSTSWIGEFLQMTENLPSPELFRKWSAIFVLGAAVERRCYASILADPIYPNLFCWLVGPPGSGKSVGISVVSNMLRDARNFKLSPLRITRAGLEDAMQTSMRTRITKTGPITDHYLISLVPELGNFLPSHDTEFLNVLNYLYDNERVYEWQTRQRGEAVKMANPSIAILGGTQPKFLASLLPEEAWGMGAMSRVIMVYQGQSPKPDLFPENNIFNFNETQRRNLVGDLRILGKLEGKFLFDKSAVEIMKKHYKSDLSPAPTHGKLHSYNARRILNLVKLSMISSLSESNELMLRTHHIEEAAGWLFEVENLMPQIFQEMSVGGHDEIMQEAWNYLFQEHMKHPDKPTKEHLLRYFLQKRVPVNMLDYTIDGMITSSMVKVIGVGPVGARTFKPNDIYQDQTLGS